MRKIRFLIMMAAMLLSCGIANAQGSEATDGQTTTLKGDLNEDGRVNAADVTVLVGIIMNTDYFLLGTDTEMPNRSNYTTIGGVVTTYKSIDDVLKAAPKVSLKADQRGTLLCPESWDVTDLVLQNEGDGVFYALTAAATDISGYNLFVSAYHGFAQQGNEHIPVPQPFPEFPSAALEVLEIIPGAETATIRCRLTLTDTVHPERWHLSARIQLTAPGVGCDPGKMRSCMGIRTNGNEFVFSVPNPGIENCQAHIRYRLMRRRTRLFPDAHSRENKQQSGL